MYVYPCLQVFYKLSQIHRGLYTYKPSPLDALVIFAYRFNQETHSDIS